jgi:hypothetical protein
MDLFVFYWYGFICMLLVWIYLYAIGMDLFQFSSLQGQVVRAVMSYCTCQTQQQIKLQIGAFPGVFKHQRVSLLLRLIATIYDRCLTQCDTQLRLLIHSPLVNSTSMMWIKQL